MSSLMETHMPIEEAARTLDRSFDSLYAFTRQGRLRPLRVKRRSFFDRHEVAALKAELARPYPVKDEAMALIERYPTLPHTDDGKPLAPQTSWDIFAAYAADRAASYETVGARFQITRQRAQQHVARVIERLTELDAL